MMDGMDTMDAEGDAMAVTVVQQAKGISISRDNIAALRWDGERAELALTLTREQLVALQQVVNAALWTPPAEGPR